MKKLLILYLVRFAFAAIALGIGVWYVCSSIGGASLSYTNMDGFLNSIGAVDGNIGNANGCFLCGYINELFAVLGTASEKFWSAILDRLWVLMILGFGIFLFVHTVKYFFKSITADAELDTKENKFVFKDWFDTVWRQGVKIMIVGAIIGAFGMGGASSLKNLSKITIEPVMYVGTELSMAATGVLNSAKCVPSGLDQTNTMAQISNSFMCIVGNINTVMLAGAAGGFAMMNYAWMGLGGGIFTWIAGFLTVLAFIIIGFDLFFQILSVIFRLIFVVMFLPIFVAALAFEKTWKMASKVTNNAVDMLIKAAVNVVAISLKVVIFYALVSYAGRDMFPGAGIFPPLLGDNYESASAETVSVHNVFVTCERLSTMNGEVDKTVFRACFDQQKSIVEAEYPNAFDFLKNGWGFLLLIASLFFLYMYVLSPKIDKLIAAAPSFYPFKKVGEKEEGGLDNFGGELKKFGKLAWNKPKDWLEKYIKENG